MKKDFEERLAAFAKAAMERKEKFYKPNDKIKLRENEQAKSRYGSVLWWVRVRDNFPMQIHSFVCATTGNISRPDATGQMPRTTVAGNLYSEFGGTEALNESGEIHHWDLSTLKESSVKESENAFYDRMEARLDELEAQMSEAFSKNMSVLEELMKEMRQREPTQSPIMTRFVESLENDLIPSAQAALEELDAKWVPPSRETSRKAFHLDGLIRHAEWLVRLMREEGDSK